MIKEIDLYFKSAAEGIRDRYIRDVNAIGNRAARRTPEGRKRLEQADRDRELGFERLAAEHAQYLEYEVEENE